MKSRLSGTIWGLIGLNGVALALVIWFAFGAGKQAANGGSMFESSGTIIAIVIAIVVSIILAWRLGSAILAPIAELSSFSERLAAGDRKARAGVNTNGEFGYIAGNLHRAGAKDLKASGHQEANECVQGSLTDLLAGDN